MQLYFEYRHLAPNDYQLREALDHVKKIKKKGLATAVNVTPYTMTKLNKGLSVSIGTMVKFCKVFHCDIEI